MSSEQHYQVPMKRAREEEQTYPPPESQKKKREGEEPVSLFSSSSSSSHVESFPPASSTPGREEETETLHQSRIDMQIERLEELIIKLMEKCTETTDNDRTLVLVRLIDKAMNEKEQLKKQRIEEKEFEQVQKRKREEARIKIEHLLQSSAVAVRDPNQLYNTRFLTEQWLDDTFGTISPLYKYGDGERSYLSPPMALVRCRRGGKTRALCEIAHRFKQTHPTCAVINITLNAETAIKNDEQDKPVEAICTRIAFVARKPDGPYGHMTFETFRKTVYVGSDDIEKWLGNSPCLLLVDELNKLKLASTNEDVAMFLKDHFLVSARRYFVFSSHVVSMVDSLEDFLQSDSGRGVVVKELPLTGLGDAKLAFGLEALTPREALLAGLIPGLIEERFCHRNNKARESLRQQMKKYVDDLRSLAKMKPREALDAGLIPAWTEKNTDSNGDYLEGMKKVDNAVILPLLLSFITGSMKHCPTAIMPFMNALQSSDERRRGEKIIQWIPMHMVELLTQLMDCSVVSEMYRKLLKAIVGHFNAFFESKSESGGAWESLCVIVLMIRIITGQLQLKSGLKILDVELPERAGDKPKYTVSYNEHLKTYRKDGKEKSFEDCSNIRRLKKIVTSPPKRPHVSIYYPKHANFSLYDAVVVVFETGHGPRYYGFQMKEGRELPAQTASSKMKRSFVFRGLSVERPTGPRNWTDLETAEIEEFFGVSGEKWTPRQWERLKQEQSESQWAGHEEQKDI